jgi:hypothetical protein
MEAKCDFAHGMRELKFPPAEPVIGPNYFKTRLCHNNDPKNGKKC